MKKVQLAMFCVQNSDFKESFYNAGKMLFVSLENKRMKNDVSGFEK